MSEAASRAFMILPEEKRVSINCEISKHNTQHGAPRGSNQAIMRWSYGYESRSKKRPAPGDFAEPRRAGEALNPTLRININDDDDDDNDSRNDVEKQAATSCNASKYT
jgi:hypothetical protein